MRDGALGKGIHARRTFRAGERILELTGRRLLHDQVLALGEAQAYALQVGPLLYIDTEAPGRYTNHSCNPNAGVLADHVLVALRTIATGEEIRFDYSTTMSEDHWTMECRCGEPGCRGTIRDFHLLAPPLQERYIRHGIVQEFIKREWRQRRAIAYVP